MALTIVVRSGGGGGGRELSLTLDAPRVVIGRGDGCEVRLPDPSVSHRHASIRQRGGEYMLVDEGSLNGTILGNLRLPPQTPRAVRSGELVRIGRVWLEIRVEPALVKGSTAAAAKELALALVERGMEAQGEDPYPRVTVLEGPDKGTALSLREVGRVYVIGRANDADLKLTEEASGRRHATVARKGDALIAQDCGSTNGTRLEGEPIREATWKAGQALQIGKTRLGLDYPAAQALVELEQSPVERMQPGEADAPPGEEPATPEAPAEPAPTETPAPPSAGWEPPSISAPAKKARAEGGWGIADAAVILLAIGVIVVSGLGALWLFSR